MFSVFVFALLSLHPISHRSSVAAPAADHEDSPWFMGCANASSSSSSSNSGLDAPEGARDLDPVACCVRCLDGGYQVAALTSEGCYCGNQPHGLVASECFNTSSKGGTEDDRAERQSLLLSLPVGGGQGSTALYRTAGPFLHSVRAATSPDRVQAGKTFVVEVSGNLAGRSDHPTGILGLRGQDLSYVTVRIEETTRKGQSSHRVKVLDGGSFVVSSDWIVEAPGEYELSIRVSNALSTLSSTLLLSVQQPFPPSLVISVLRGPLGVPSCIPFPLTDSSSVRVEAVYQGVRVTLQADVIEALAADFSWWFAHEDERENMEGIKTVCSSNSTCLNSTVNWTFDREGVHVVSVNASGAYGWTQETIHVAVVRFVVSDLRVSVSDSQPTSGDGFSVDLELFTTMKHLLILNCKLNAEHGGTDAKDNVGITSRFDFSNKETTSDNTADFNKAGNHSIQMTHLKNSNAHSLNQNMCSHGGTYIYLYSDTPLHMDNSSSCHLHLHLHCHLPVTAGQHQLTASVLSTSDLSSVLISTTMMLYEHMRALRPSGSWKSVVSTHVEFSLEVASPTRRVGSRLIWTFSLEDVIVIRRTTREWDVNVSLPTAGCYKVTVQAFNPVSRASFCTYILVQDPVGELVLNVPSGIRTNQKHFVLFGVTAGSNVTVSLLVNATLLHRSSSYTTGEEATAVLFFNHTGTVVVELRAENQVSSQNKTARVCVEGNRKPSSQVRVNPTWQPPTGQSPVHSPADNVQIYATKQAYPTNAEVTFTAVTEASDPVEFLWHFGDSTTIRTTSRRVTKRYIKPGWYDVTVVMSRGRTTLTSDVFPLVVQRAVTLNRLLHQASVLQNQTVEVSCRVNTGTDVSFLWSFGDGSNRTGQSTEQHVFLRTGEFRVKVNVSNLVSSASLSSHIFVVDRPCQPPPVKNMGPLKIQVRRYEVIHLGVTYETEVDCDISGGLHYTWTVFDSAGRAFSLPLIETHRQSLILPSYLLHYDTYTAIARVQVIGSVVYSNYSVRVQVMPSPPVVIIQGSTNIFINGTNTSMITLDGQRSHDLDFPTNSLSFSWTCKPVSSIATSCFHQEVPTSSPVLVFPAALLKSNFDQFQFTLTIRSGERLASSETFLTLASSVIRKVSVYCPHCQGELVNWDQSFSVNAVCEGCDVPPKYVQYTWSLYVVNASSKPLREVPFCSTVDLGAPSTIMEGPSSSWQAPAISTQKAFESRAKKLNVNVTDSGTLWKRKKTDRKKSATAGLTAGSGEEPFYHPPGEFDPPEPLYSSTEYQPLALDNSGVLYSDHFGWSDVISEFPVDSDSSADWEFSFPVSESADLGGRLDSDYDVPVMNAEEGDSGISAGRPTGLDAETFSPGDDSEFDPVLQDDQGSNLVDSRLSVVIREPTLLDLSRDLVDKGVFESYTYTGISSPLLSFRPFSLRPGSRYMLEVTANSHGGFLGRTQLFLKTNPAPKGVTCQVQPKEGTELHTHFSIFCTSGKEDLVYEYSVRVGNRPPRMLYQGRDFQYYFSLPSGDPNDDYKVTIYTKIRSSMYGTATKPCPVTVRVQPTFFRDSSSSSSLDPDLELSESGLKNLSALLQLGNSAEVSNYINLLTSILNGLSLDSEANTNAQRRTRNALICVLCELEGREQAPMVDNISILKELLQVTNQVTFASARQVAVHVQVISGGFSESPVWYYLDQETLNTLVALLSYSLQAAVTCNDFTAETSSSADTKQASESDSHEELVRIATAPSNGCIPESTGGDYIKRGGSITAKQTAPLVADILQAASDLMLKYVLFFKAQEHRVSTGFMALHTAYQNQTSTVISSGPTTFYMPAPLIQYLFAHGSIETESRQCVFSMLTELTHSPYTWAHIPGRVSGPVVDLSLYECSTRKKIPVRSLVQPINIELQQPPGKESSVREYVLRRTQINYHSFNITQEHLQQAIQLSVVFMPPLNKAFPIMLLFRMFERPTPSMHHLQRTHRWGSNSTQLNLPPSYLSTAGVGHLALLSADIGKAPRHKHLSEEVSYRLTVESSLCLSWDDQQEAWTQRGCRTQQGDTTTAVNCSCHHLRPLTVVQQQIQSSNDTTDLHPFLSVSSDLTVLGVLVLCMCLYIPGLVACRRADVVSEVNRRVHYLPDNSPQDPYLYAVTVHTGPCSAASMSAKVYVVLNGENGVSQTKELQASGCSVFRRNSQDTFIFSAADSLGSVWGVHIWHDSSGPSPTWYLKQVEVSEVSRGHVEGRDWLFVGQCWLAVNKGDGQVERTLRVCTQAIGFTKMLPLKLSDYLADYHIWMSVHICPCPNSFTRTQRLSVSMLLLLGYACVNTAVISQMDDELLFELGIIDVSVVSVMTGVLSVVAVLPAAAMISFLFRLRGLELLGPGVKHAKSKTTFFEDSRSLTDTTCEPHLSWSSLQLWAQEAWRKKYQDPDVLPPSTMNVENKNTHKDPVFIRKDAFNNDTGPALHLLMTTEDHNVDRAARGKESDLLSESSRFHVEALLSETRDGGEAIHKKEDVQGQRNKGSHHRVGWPGHSICYHVTDWLKGTRFRPVSQWCHYTAWSLCLLLSLSCLVLSAVLGTRFSSGQVLLWIHTLFFSLMFCIFLIQPAVIITAAVIVSFWSRKRADFHSFSSIRESEASHLWSHSGVKYPEGTSASPQDRCSYLKKVGARQRARYLRLVRPPSPGALRKSRGRKRRDALLHKTLRDLSLCGSMLLLMLCINYSSSSTDHYHLNKAVRKRFIRGHGNAFMSIQKQEDWWKWADNSLINLLYQNASVATESHIMIGEPMLWRTEASGLFQDQVSGVSFIPDCLRSYLSGSQTSTHRQSTVFVPMATPPVTCGRLGCYVGPSAKVGFSRLKSDAASKLRFLRSSGWLGRQTMALKVQFTLFSPAPNLFTSVSMLAEQSPTGVLVPSATVQSVRVYHTPAVWDYVAMVCQLLFLLLSLLQLCDQVHTVGQQGLMGYWRTPHSWLDVSLLTVTPLYYFYYIYHSTVIWEVVELLQRHSHRGHIDVSLLATCEQCIRTLRGVVLFILAVKCVTVLRMSRTLAPSATLLTRSLSHLFWPTISGVVLMVALSCMGNLLFAQSSWRFNFLHTLLCRYRGPRALKGLHFSWSNFLYHGVLCLSTTVVSTAMAIGVVSSLVRSAKRSNSRRNVFTVAELVGYIRRRVPDFTGQRRKARIENQMEEKTYYFEEFESLVDELLFRLNALSNSLHHTHTRCRKEDSPHVSPIQERNIMKAQDFGSTQITDKRPVNDHTASHLLWSRLEQEILHQRGRKGDDSLDSVVASDSQQPEKRAEENLKDRELQTVRVWTEQVNQWTKTNKSGWLNESQATHTEVVVEVLVHEDPGSVKSDRQQGLHGDCD